MTTPVTWPEPTHDSLRAKLSRWVSPSAGYCLRCGMTWRHAREHATPYSVSSSCFPLCQPCWQQLTPVGRLPYYRALVDVWEAGGAPRVDDWRRIAGAVLEGR